MCWWQLICCLSVLRIYVGKHDCLQLPTSEHIYLLWKLRFIYWIFTSSFFYRALEWRECARGCMSAYSLRVLRRAINGPRALMKKKKGVVPFNRRCVVQNLGVGWGNTREWWQGHIHHNWRTTWGKLKYGREFFLCKGGESAPGRPGTVLAWSQNLLFHPSPFLFLWLIGTFSNEFTAID